MLAASEREWAGRGSLYIAQENFSPTPNKGVRPCSVHQLCLQYLLSYPQQSLLPRTKRNPPKDQGGSARPDPTLRCLQSQNAPSWLVWRQAAGAAQRVPGLCISTRAVYQRKIASDCVEQKPQKTVRLFHTRNLEVGRQEVHVPGSSLSSCSARGWLLCLWLQNGTSFPHLLSHTPGRQQGGERLTAKTACRLHLAFLIRKTVISQQVSPGRFPLVAHQPELSHMATPSCKGTEEAKCFSWVQNPRSDREQEGFGVGC